MDERPPDRRMVNSSSEPEPTRRPPEEPQPIKKVEPEPVYRPTPISSAPVAQRSTDEKKSLKRFMIPAIVVVIIIIAAVIFAMTRGQNQATAIDSSEYQGVILTDNESYIGKLSPLNDRFMKLTDIFYLKSQTGTSSTDSQQSTVDQGTDQLIKLGAEIQGPEDEMIISKDQIVYYENLKPSGKAAQAIAQYKKSH